jgi:hypothetical protein
MTGKGISCARSGFPTPIFIASKELLFAATSL